ncbi:MAG: hypothetical protein ACRCYR_07950 [Phycicoccus sp.]
MTSSEGAVSIRPERARLVVEDSMELLGQITYELTALRALVCPPSAWGQLGATACTGTQQWMQQLNQALATCVQFHEQVQRLINGSANLYQDTDEDIGEQYRDVYFRQA